jgi:outer membrane protein TolC
VLDSDAPAVQDAADAVADALRTLLGDDHALRLLGREVAGRPLSTARARAALDRARRADRADLVIAVGHGTSTAAIASAAGHTDDGSGAGPPVLAPWALDAWWHGREPAPDGGSGLPRCHWLADPATLPAALAFLREFTAAEEVALLVPPVVREAARAAHGGQLPRHAPGNAGATLSWIALPADPAAAVAAIAASADAAVVLGGHLTAERWESLATALRQRSLPAYALGAPAGARAGLLGGAAADAAPGRLARRLALHVQRLLAGTPAAALPVSVTRRTHPLVNRRTATDLGLAIPRHLRLEAEFVGGPAAPDTAALDLPTVMRTAARVQPRLAAARAAVAAGAQEVSRARSSLWPRLTLEAGARQIDADRARAALGREPERAASVGGTLEQVLYSEPAHAAVGIQEQRQRGREQRLRRERLDAMLAAATAYLDLLRARTAERIRREDLHLVRTHRDLARRRRAAGLAGPAEVERWEARLARRRAELTRADARTDQAAVALNAALDRPLEAPTAAAAVAPVTVVGAGDLAWLRSVVDDPARFRRLRDWLASEARRRSPRLQMLDAARQARRRALTAADRAWWVPQVALFGDLDHRLAAGGDGIEGFGLAPGAIPPAQRPFARAVDQAFPPPPGETSWSVGLRLSLPLWTGGERRAEQLGARRELARIDHEHAAAALVLARRVRQAAHAAGASLAVIGEAEAAAAAADRTLSVLTDAYARGTVGVVDLLGAQNAALEAELRAAAARYDFVADYLAAERAAGVFGLLLPPERQRERAASRRGHVAGEAPRKAR